MADALLVEMMNLFAEDSGALAAVVSVAVYFAHELVIEGITALA